MTPPSRLPYPGLRAFTREESDLFFGRDGCVDAMVDRLAATRFLAVLGSSGSGKSSLVRTGLLDALDLGLHPWAGARWKVADLHPGGQPIRNLAAGLLISKDGGTPDAMAIDLLAAFLRRGPRSIAEWASGGNLEPGCNLLLLVDQFEELFRYGNYARQEEAEAFVTLLLETVALQGINIHVVVTMRSEFLGACALMPGLAEKINAGLYLTPRMTREECREAIEGPAGVMGFSVDPALVNRLLNDLASFAPWEADDAVDQAERLARRADQLPLMQHVLNRLWARADNAGGTGLVLRLADYDGLGGLSGAIDAHGNEILSALGDARARRVEAVFRSLVSGSGVAAAVRRPCRVAELVEAVGDRDDVVAIIEAFSAPDCNFLRTSEQSLSDTVIVDISHESLIRQWMPLRNWLENEARAGAAWRRLVAAEERYSRGEGGLLTGLDLQNLAAWWESASPTPSWTARHGNRFEAATEFLQASRKAEADRAEIERKRAMRERNRLRIYIAGLAAGLLVSTYFGYRSHKETNLARMESQEATNAEAKAKSAESAAIANAAESKANAKKSADFLNNLSDVLYSDESSDLVGTRGLRSQLMGKFLPYQTELSRQNESAFKPVDRVRNDYRQALSFQSIGDAQRAMESYRTAYEDGLASIQQLPEGSPPDEALTTSFVQDAYYYAWYLLDIGEREKGGAVLNTTKGILERCHFPDRSSDFLLAEGRFENLESRYAFDMHQTKLAEIHLTNAVALARRAVASPSSGLAAKSFAVGTLGDLMSTTREPKRATLVTEVCNLAAKMKEASPMSIRSIGAQVSCLIHQSDEAAATKDSGAAIERMQKASDEIGVALSLDPGDPNLLLTAAGIENSLGDLDYQKGQHEAEYRHRMTAKDDMVKALTGRTPVQAGARQLRFIFDNCSRVDFPNTDQELKFYQEIFEAMKTTLDAFPKSPSFAYIAGKAAVRIGEILKEDKKKQKEAEEYLSKAVMWLDRSGVIHQLSDYSEDFNTYCAAYEQRAFLYASMDRANDVLADARKMRSACTPALEKYPWDYYLRVKLIDADYLEGVALAYLKDYKEAVPPLGRASHWGLQEASQQLANIYSTGLGVAKDKKKADELLATAQKQTVAKFSIPVDFGSGDEQEEFNAWEWPADYTKQFPGISDQVRVYKDAQGATVNPQRAEAIRKIQEIAIRNDFYFPQLCSPETYMGAVEQRYQSLLNGKKEAEAKKFESDMVAAVEQLAIALQNEPANRAAWQIYTNRGDHLLPTDKNAARQAFTRGAEFAELLPQDKPDDLFSRIESFNRLARLDLAAGKVEDSRAWVAKSDSARKSLHALVAKTLDHPLTDAEAFGEHDTLLELEREDSEAGDQSAARLDLSHDLEILKNVKEDTPDGAYGKNVLLQALGDAFLKDGSPSEAHDAYLRESVSLERYVAFRLETPARVSKFDGGDMSEIYGALSWANIEAGRFEKAIEAAQAGLKLKPDADWIEANLAHGMLLTGKRDEAIQHYMHARKGNVNGQTIVEATKDDFDHLRKLGFSDPQMASILVQMNKQEVK